MADKRKADEVAVPANIRGAQEDAARRTPPYPGDGTNTGETTPQAGPESGVTAVQAESNPDVPFDAHAREALRPGPERRSDGGRERQRAQEVMPLYAYRCAAGHRWEEFRKIADRATDQACPTCGADGWWVYSPPAVSNSSNGTLASLGHDLYPARTPRRAELAE